MLTLLCAVVTTAWGTEKTDVLDRAFTGVTGTSYTDWSGKTGTSGAVYAGNSAGGKESIQLRTNNNNSGVVTTASGGKVKSITITWNTETLKGRTLNVYGSNSAYSAATDLYDESKQGTLLGTIVNGTSTKLTIDGDYKYIGFRSDKDAMYLTSVEITWEATSTTKKTATVSIDKTSIEVGETATITTDGPAITLTSSVADVVDISGNEITGKSEGETTITASWEETDDYYGGSKSFTIKVNPASEAVTFEKVTNANQLVAGNEFILVASVSSKAMSGVSSNGNFRLVKDITISGDKIQIKESEVAVLTIGGTSGAYTFKASDNKLYLAINNTEGNYLQSSDNASAASSQWSVGSDFSLTNKSYSTRYIAYNKTNSRFATYTSGQEKAVLYVKEGYKTDDNILKDPDLSIEDVRLALDDGETELEVTTLSDGAISFETSDEDVASIEERGGKYYVVAAGSGICEITATQVETDEYTSATITFKVYVTDEKASGVYKRVTSTSELVAGKQYIIVAPDDNVAMGGSSSNGNYRVNIKAKVLEIGSEDAANQYVTITDNDPVTMLTLGGQSGSWTLLTYDKNDYLSLNSDANNLNTASSVTDNSSWNITINSELNISITNKKFTSRSIRYNSGSGQERFACYKSGMKDAVLFVKVESIPVDITSVGYATLYYSDKNLIVPSGVVAKTVELTTAGDNIQTSRTYEAGKIIPKDCGVLLEAVNKDENTQTFFFAEGITSDTADPNNLLYGLDEDGTTVGPDDSTDYIFYMLSTDKNGKNVGFYWKNGGAPFTTKAHKAYLAIPKSSNINVSSFVFDDLTGIRAITDNVSQNAEGVYTLSGIRVNSNQLPKGIYIVNGKKVVIK